MREIKFRAWYKKEKKWLHRYGESRQGNYIDGELIVIGGWLSEVSLENFNHIVIMQCTGLKDKNGKESYLSDLCRLKDHTDIYEIKWCNEFAAFYFYGINGNEKRSMNREFHIIGNIYENTELLK